MTKIAREVAEKEVNRWLDTKKVSERKRSEAQDQIETMIEAVSEGYLVISEDGTITQKLKFPVTSAEGGGTALAELKFKQRVKMEAVRVQLARVKNNDLLGMIFGYMAAATGEPVGMLKEIYSDDYNTSSAIVSFFF